MKYNNYKTKGKIQSLNGEVDNITILEKMGDNKYLVDYKGTKCQGIFNIFTNCYYVDDKYGRLKQDKNGNWIY